MTDIHVLAISDLDDETLDKISKNDYQHRPHIKFVRKIAPIQEAVFFAGGVESANEVIEWVMMHGDSAEHISNQTGLISEWVRVIGIDDFTGDPVRSAVRPNQWLVYEGLGVYSRVYPSTFQENYQRFIATEEKGNNDVG